MSTRAEITALCMTQAALVKLVPWGTQELGRLPATVIGKAQALVTQLAEEGASEQVACARLWNELFRDLRTDDWARHPSAPGAFALDNPRGTIPPKSVQG